MTTKGCCRNQLGDADKLRVSWYSYAQLYANIAINPMHGVNVCARDYAHVGVPTSEMLFFDDEPYSNMEVTSLGVTFVDATGGVTEEMIVAGLEAYASTR